ncbi:pseudouridylate synthase TRUB1-like, partial [Saccoglossus kowalevskii]
MCVSAMAVSLAESQLMKLNGLFAVRKPVGITSADVIRKLKKRLYKDCQEKTICGGRRLRIGHGGTLDKNASGVLVIGIGKGTKQLTKYLKGNKHTTEYDHITHQSFENMLQKFIGNLMQVPPIYSALKIDGQRMSSLVSQGIAVDPKPARPVEVH